MLLANLIMLVHVSIYSFIIIRGRERVSSSKSSWKQDNNKNVSFCLLPSSSYGASDPIWPGHTHTHTHDDDDGEYSILCFFN